MRLSEPLPVVLLSLRQTAVTAALARGLKRSTILDNAKDFIGHEMSVSEGHYFLLSFKSFVGINEMTDILMITTTTTSITKLLPPLLIDR